jgi:hypothetical protein
MPLFIYYTKPVLIKLCFKSVFVSIFHYHIALKDDYPAANLKIRLAAILASCSFLKHPNQPLPPTFEAVATLIIGPNIFYIFYSVYTIGKDVGTG